MSDPDRSRRGRYLGANLTHPFTAVIVAVLMTLPVAASAHHVTDNDLRDVFYTFADPEPLEPHGRVRPFLNPYEHGVDPTLRCVGDAVGTWAGWVVSYSDGEEPADYPSRREAMAFLNSVEETYRLDVHSDGDPVDLITMRSGVRWTAGEAGESLLRFNQGVPVIDDALLPEGHHTLYWTARADGIDVETDGTPIWIADCDRETNLVANADDVAVEISTIDVSGYYNVIYLEEPYEQLVGVDGSGSSVTLFGVGDGIELVFRIDVYACPEGSSYPDANCSQEATYYSGPASNNQDGQKYSLHIADGETTWVFFNDNQIDPDGADEPFEPNYIDAIFTVRPASPGS